ncbi:Sugar transporter [Lasiodiplodia theobromae]|uniref:Sugar transporter n=1 Tax=Lasiodiplodia theobromae TaxID=45133 RepID=UPI0015C3614B|nr:Sugar transporter [Lasiodiplodia theobromae]KAF4536491.1 Sugar transporter [Lasiodiplodia theobromae]
MTRHKRTPTTTSTKGAAAAILDSSPLAAVLPSDLPPWYRRRNLLRLNFCLLSLILFSSANGYDGSLMNGLQALPQWNAFMRHPTGAWLGFVNAASSLGSIVQYPVAAWVGNRFGRKAGVWVGYGFLVLGVGLQSGAMAGGEGDGSDGGDRGVAMFVLGRFFVGCVSAWFMVTTPLLIAETAFPTHRGVLTSMFNCGWYVGSMLAAWVTFGTQTIPNSWSWRIPSLLQAALPLLALPGYLLCPESPRWLVSQGRTAEARAFFLYYHGDGTDSSSSSSPPSTSSTTPSPPSPSPSTSLADFELAEVQRALTLEQSSTKTSNNSYAAMLRTPGNRHRLLISLTLGVSAQWNGSGIVSYYLPAVLSTAGIHSVRTQTLINGCIQAWNLLCATFSAVYLVDRLGRRPLFLLSCGGMLACYVAISALAGVYDGGKGAAGVGVAVIPMLFLYYAAYDAAFTPLLVAYPCEIWPYALRARGVTVTIATTNVAILFNTLVNPIALEGIGWRYYIVYVVLLVVIGATCYFFYPETRGCSLEEVARVFDGEKADVSVGLGRGGGGGEGGGLWQAESAASSTPSSSSAGEKGVEVVLVDQAGLTHRRTHSV